MMDLSLLPSFVVFAETLNFTAAGKRLHLSQPAVHLHVKRLEDAVGRPLYRRVGRALVLTAEGRSLLAFARETAARQAELYAELGRGPARAPVLAAGEGALLYLLGPAISAHRGPLEVRTRDRESATEAVRTGEADVAVIGSPEHTPEPEGLVTRTLTKVGSMLVVPRGHALAKKAHVGLKALEGARLVVPPAGRPHRETLARRLAEEGVRWEVGIEASGWELAIHLATLGLGLAVVNACCRVPAGAVGVELRGLPAIRYALVHAHGGGRAPRPAVRGLIEVLLAHRDGWRG